MQINKYLKLLQNSGRTIACLMVLAPSIALAAAAPKATPPPPTNPSYGQALEIAPPVVELTANPGQSINTQIYLRDISSGPLIVSGEADDFAAAGENGTPKIL